jgi:YD repeat-containing protein
MVNAGTDATAGGSVISLPSGGGAIGGLGEKFATDLFTGTGNFSVPITLPAGRNGLAPQLSLGYSTGNGNGPFGLGWVASLPGVARKTARGVPRYQGGSDDGPRDVFIVSGAEDLVPVADDARGRVRYRPRSEGLFARIEHVRDDTGDYWEVRSRDGLLTRYGTPRPTDAAPDWRDPAVTDDRASGGRGRVFAWRITETTDAVGNLVRYRYARDHGEESGHAWDQPIVSRIEYADYGERADPSFLVRVDFEYEQRPDPFSDYRAGFEARTTLRCSAIRVSTHAADGIARAVREYRFGYEQAPFNGASLLTRVEVVGVDDQSGPPRSEHMPPLTFEYTAFEPQRRRFGPVTGAGLPTRPLGDPTMAMVDLRGRGLPDIVELGATARYWRNLGGGRFDLPRAIPEAPPQRLGEPGVQFIDADGDGRADLLVKSANQAGYFPMTFAGGWSRRSFQPYRQAPTVGLDDPRVKLVDLDGDGLTDVIRSGSSLQCWFNDADPRRAWQRTAVTNGPAAGIDLADPHIRLADMTGDGLQDIVLLRSGNIAYWPNLGHGRFGSPVQMRRAPRLPDGHDPRRLLLGDVDGDGVADLVYVDHGRVLLWGNNSGNAWTPEPVTVTGTPDVVSTDSVQFADLRGTGMAGLLFSRGADGSSPATLRFLDITDGHKPHLLNVMNNHLGAHTIVEYVPSTQFLLADETDPATRWRTPLPFPVHVVARVEVHDQISSGRLSTEYRYHHGYWDGIEREFRGFAMVEQLDTETFDDEPGVHHSPPTLTKTWFHVGPVAAVEADDWTELDLTHEYWPDDTPMLTRPVQMTEMLAALPRRVRRDALRALRGQTLRSELYALDGTDRRDRPYTVTESLTGMREECPPAAGDMPRDRIFFAFGVGQRTTQWERGIDPMTRFAFTSDPDEYGMATRQLTVAVPRGRDPLESLTAPAEPYLATTGTTEYARRDDTERYLVDRVARTTTREVRNDGTPSVFELRDAVLDDAVDNTVSLRVIEHSRTFYDGEPYLGLPLGRLGDHGLAVRSETLMVDDRFLDEHFDAADPRSLGPRPAYLDPSGATAWGTEYPDEFHALMPELAGYVHYDDADLPGSLGGYYSVTARHRYDVHDPHRVPRGLPLGTLDAFGAESRVRYDRHDLLPTVAVDPVGLATRADNDLRTLQPRRVTDPNGNTSRVRFSPAGFVTARFVSGKNGEGDTTVPSVRMEYDLLAFAERRQPVQVRTVARIHHDTDTDVPAGERDDEIVSVEYSNGFGRLLQTRTQAEDVLFGDNVFGRGVLSPDQTEPVTETVGRTRPAGAPDNVIVSGWQVYDNKGRVVEKYEPFFATGYDFMAPVDAELGRKAIMSYDPRGQAIRTVNPDGSEQLTVIGVPIDLADPDVFAPTPWEAFAYDANDNAGRTHGTAAESYQNHWNTPASTEVDALGRAVTVVARNGPDPDTDWFVTRTTYDIQGNVTALTDALDREAFLYRYDLAGRRWRMDSIDAGRRDTVFDALGNPIEARDSRGALTMGAFDALHRQNRVWARDDAAGSVTLRQRIEYGDGGDPDQPASDRAAARAHNLLGHPAAHYDEAGLVTVTDVDFKGNVLDAARQVIADAPILATYDRAAADHWHVRPFRVDWQPGPGQTPAERTTELLDSDRYRTTSRFDALNRPVAQVLPTDVEGRRRELRPRYNRAGGLEQVRLDDALYVERIAYDASGQRALAFPAVRHSACPAVCAALAVRCLISHISHYRNIR